MVFVQVAKALFDCVGDEESELSFHEGDILTNIRESAEEGWLFGRVERTGEEGLFPDNYVELQKVELPKPTLPSRITSEPMPQSASAPISAQFPSVAARTTTAQATFGASAGTTGVGATGAKPTLPTRPGPGITSASSPAVTSGSAGAGIALPGMGKPGAGFPTRNVVSGPPLLPKRTPAVASGLTPGARQLPGLGGARPPVNVPDVNALPVTGGISRLHLDEEDEEAEPAPALSVRERMANLSMASRPMTTSGLPSTSPSIPSATPYKAGVPAAGSGGASQSTSKPFLPPRNLTPSSTAKPVKPIQSSDVSREATSQTLPDSTMPVPKLITFNRPRSARTANTNKSPTASSATRSLAQMSASSPPLTATSADPPKLPSRTGSNASLASINSVSTSPKVPPAGASTNPAGGSPSAASGPVRFSSSAIMANTANSPAPIGLPTIAPKMQPRQLPSRQGSALSSPATGIASVGSAGGGSVGAGAKATPGADKREYITPLPFNSKPAAATTNSLRPVPTSPSVSATSTTPSNSTQTSASPFGVKLNPVSGTQHGINDSTPPILPSRPISIPSAAPLAPSSASVRDASPPPPPLPQRASTMSPTPSTPATDLKTVLPGAVPKSVPAFSPRPVKSAVNISSASPSSQQNAGHNSPTPWTRPPPATPSRYTPTQNSPKNHQNTNSNNSMDRTTPTEPLAVPKDALHRYEALFRAQTSTAGYMALEGPQVHAIFIKSRLDSKVLAKIWSLIDTKSSGQLNRAQFCVGLYLVDEQLRTRGQGQLPPSVPDSLWISVGSPS